MQFTPTIVIHDVLQARLFSPAQLEAVRVRPMFEWFKECVERLKGKRIKLAVVANGIDLYPEWVEMIKKNKWEVQCHGLIHHEMHKMDEEESYRELSEAKEMLERTFHQRVTQFYPMRHKVSPHLYEASRKAGMSLMLDRYRPIHMLTEDFFIPEVYIHYWNKKNVDDAVKLCHRPETI